jgi:hypothetical protein
MDNKILDDLTKNIGIEELINVILVNENVRPAMLIQPADYKEATGADEKTKLILMSIKNNFPNLIFSEKYKGLYQGIIISKKGYDNEVINLDDMGKILGYPCYNDFTNLDREKITYSIGLQAVLNDGKGNAEIFSNACSNNSIRPTFDKIAMDATNVLKSNKLIKSIIEKVEVVEYIIIPTSIIINKLINNTILNQAEKDKIQNILYNFGFGFDIQFFFKKSFDYQNEVHKGILLGLLVYERNDPIMPFSPLQKYSKKIIQQYNDAISKWESELIVALQNTKTKSTGGNTRRRRRRRK